MANDAMQDLKAQVDRLLEAAQSGAIIPIRLPGQIEEIRDALLKVEQQAADELAAAKQQAAVTGDAGEIMQENAEFLKTAVHELRTPVTSIRGYSDMLANPQMVGELSDMQSQMLAVVRTNTRRLEGLLADISIINKVRAHILPIHEKMDMFKNIAQMAEKKMRPLADELNRQLEFDIPQGLPLLNTDGEHFATAMTKLIENGLRYSAEGDGKVTISARGEDGTLVVTVADNGIGMTEDELARLGEIYYRADHDLVREYKGSGLGVAIAYGLIDALGGDINVESSPDKGTIFTIRLKGMS